MWVRGTRCRRGTRATDVALRCAALAAEASEYDPSCAADAGEIRGSEAVCRAREKRKTKSEEKKERRKGKEVEEREGKGGRVACVWSDVCVLVDDGCMDA